MRDVITSYSIHYTKLYDKLENAVIGDLGQAKRIVIDKDNTTIVEGSGKKAEIKARESQIRAQIEKTTSDS